MFESGNSLFRLCIASSEVVFKIVFAGQGSNDLYANIFLLRYKS